MQNPIDGFCFLVYIYIMNKKYRTDMMIESLNDALKSDTYSLREKKNIRSKKRRVLAMQNDGYNFVIFQTECFDIRDQVETRIKSFEI